MNRLFVALLGILTSLGIARGPAMAASDKPIRIVAFGDSLTAGYGLRPDESFPVQLERHLKARGFAIEIANAGVSGDTTSGGLARIDWAISDGVDAVILELGANDALSGRPPAEPRKNLDEILTRLKARGLDVLIAGMRAPRNLGEEYTSAFDAIFPDLAVKHGSLLYPFFLEGVALDRKLNLSDGIHPTAEGITRIVERITPSVERLIARVRARR